MVTILRSAQLRLQACAPSTMPWFVCDRAADCHSLLSAAVDSGAMFTVRSSYERTIELSGRQRKLWATLRRQPVLGHIEGLVPPGEERIARAARLELRAITTNVRIRNRAQGERWERLSCVRIREVGTTPTGEKPIEWKLLSNHEVRALSDAKLVLLSYTRRWRIEDFHKTWKSGACKVWSALNSGRWKPSSVGPQFSPPWLLESNDSKSSLEPNQASTPAKNLPEKNWTPRSFSPRRANTGSATL